MIAPMARIEVIFLRSQLNAVLDRVQELGVVHLEDVPLALEEAPGYLHRIHLPEPEKKELDTLEEWSRILRECLALVSPPADQQQVAKAAREISGNTVAQWNAQNLAAQLRQWHRTLRTLHRRRLNIEDNLTLLHRYEVILRAIAPLLQEHSAVLGKTARVLILSGYTPEQIDALERRLIQDIGPECQFIQRPLQRMTVAVLLINKPEKQEALTALLRAEGIAVLDPPDRSVAADTVDDLLKRVEQRVSGLSADLDQVLSELQVFSEQYAAKIEAWRIAVADRLAQLRAVDHLAQSRMVGVLHGWLPADAYENFYRSLKQQFGAQIAIGKLPMDEIEPEHIPTLLRNHWFFKPFELVMGFLRPATYGTFDPTPVVALSFLLFYGFIIGDMGYGLTIWGVASWAKARWRHIPMLRDGMTIVQYMGISSIIFGFIYLEFFGDTLERLGLHPLFPRGHETTLLLALAVGMGLIHVPLGLIVGIVEGYKHGHVKHARERLGLLLGLLALLTVISSGGGYLPLPSSLAYLIAGLLFLGSLFCFVRSMGGMAPLGIMEIVGLSSNILSYARLMALGMAGIAFAGIANGIPASIDNPLLKILVGIPAALLIHLLNIGISVFSPTIHSLRLNFVEFLPKFYEPEGRKYQPFRKEAAW